MPQTVVLIHERPDCQTHYDWLIDQPDLNAEHRLRTFRLTQPPDQPGTFLAQQAPDHRSIYLNYEGELSNNRGKVARIAAAEALFWEQSTTQISAQIRWKNCTLHYTAHLEPGSSTWIFTASTPPTP